MNFQIGSAAVLDLVLAELLEASGTMARLFKSTLTHAFHVKLAVLEDKVIITPFINHCY